MGEPKTLEKENIFTKLQKLDRRYIYILLFILVGLPLLYPLGIPISVGPETLEIKSYIDAIPDEGVVLMTFDFTIGWWSDQGVETVVVMKDLFKKDVKLYMVAWSVEGPLLVEKALKIVNPAKYGKVYGEDYVNLGYLAGAQVSMESFADDVWGTCLVDHYGTPVADIPIMQYLHGMADVDLVIGQTSGDVVRWYIPLWYHKYDVKIIELAQTMAIPTYVPYYNAGSLKGILYGARGAAEYESLTAELGDAIKSMDAMSLAHLMIYVFVILGNLGYFYSKSKGVK